MEKKLNKKIHDYMRQFKEQIKAKFKFIKDTNNIDDAVYKDFLSFIYDYENLNISGEDLAKRKRVKNTVPLHERCCALRANLEQCTRRKKEGEEFCGTHIKGRPHGEVSEKKTGKSFKKIEVWAQDINGIIYYIDNEENVYDHNDIMNGVVDPKVIAKYKKTENDEFYIPNIFDS